MSSGLGKTQEVKTDDFEFRFSGSHLPCTTCGGVAETFKVMAVGTSTDGRRVWVCDKCLAGGDQKIDGVLEQRALLVMEDAARNAEELRSLIGKIRTLPTHKQWKAEAEYRHYCYGSDVTREQWDRWTPEQREHWRKQTELWAIQPQQRHNDGITPTLPEQKELGIEHEHQELGTEEENIMRN